MPKKLRSTFSHAQRVLLHKTANRVFEDKFKSKGKQTSMAKALGLSQTSVSALLRGVYTPSVEVASELALLAGYDDLKDLTGPYYQPAADESGPLSSSTAMYPNLRKCVAFYENRWKPWVVAAAEAGYFADDVAPAAWAGRLDALAAALEKHRHNAV